MAGSKEDAETVVAFFQDLRARGLGDPLLVVSDGAPGIIKAPCGAAGSPQPRWARPAFRARPASAAWPIACATWRPRCPRINGPSSRPGPRPSTRPPAGPSRATRPRASSTTTKTNYPARSPAFVTISRPASPICGCRSAIAERSVPPNLLERLFVEERRRLKIIPNAFGEKPVLELMFGAMIRAAERWRARDHRLRATAARRPAQGTGPGLRRRNRPREKPLSRRSSDPNLQQFWDLTQHRCGRSGRMLSSIRHRRSPSVDRQPISSCRTPIYRPLLAGSSVTPAIWSTVSTNTRGRCRNTRCGIRPTRRDSSFENCEPAVHKIHCRFQFRRFQA